MVDPFLGLIGKLGGIIFQRTDRLRRIQIDFIMLIIDKVTGATKISQF